MNQRLKRFVLLACMLSIPGGVVGAEETPPEPGVRIDTVDGWHRLHAVLPGSIVSYALPRIGNGPRQIVLLVRPVLDAPAAEPESTDAVATDVARGYYTVEQAADLFGVILRGTPPKVQAEATTARRSGRAAE